MNGAREVVIRRATLSDFDSWFDLFDAVAAEGKWIAGESPSDRSGRKRAFEQNIESADTATFLAEVRGELVGLLGMELRWGIADLGMAVDARWRGRGVGSKLMETSIPWARGQGAHKVVLTVWPHNSAAIALYRKYGFEQEANFRRQYRRRNGQLWDAIGMGLVLDWESPGNPCGA
jgi:ribosomal protein S18 acetylase RimI-like enzyme